jgi:acetylornithine deacetylase
VPGLGFTLERRIARAAFDADPSWPIVTALLAQAERVLGARPTIRGEPFWTDAGLLDQAGIPCLLIGVAGGGAHADEEWVDAQSVHRLTELLTGTLAEFCA